MTLTLIINVHYSIHSSLAPWNNASFPLLGDKRAFEECLTNKLISYLFLWLQERELTVTQCVPSVDIFSPVQM